MRIKCSTHKDPVKFITVYLNEKLTEKQLNRLKDILPNPGYHDKGFFHINEYPIHNPHYHIIMDYQPSKSDIKAIEDRIREVLIDAD